MSPDINLLRTVGKALHRAKALDPGDWDEEPDAYQLGLLRRKLRSADIPVADIYTNETVYKDKPEEWWFVEGAKYVERLKQAWRPASSERLTKEMMEKVMLSPSECEAVVTDPSFA